MEFNKASLEVIATVFGTTVEELSGASSNENEANPKLTLNGGRVITQAEEAELKTKLTTAGVEIGYKKLAKEANIDLQGDKTPESIMSKLTATITSSLEDKYKNMTPLEETVAAKVKIEELTQQLSTAQGTIENNTTILQQHKDEYTALQADIAIKERNVDITKLFNPKSTQPVGDALVLYDNTFIEKVEDGVTKIYKGDILQTNAAGHPSTRTEVVSMFEEEKGWITGSGMGGRDTNGNTKPEQMDYDRGVEYLQEKNIDPFTPEGQEFLANTKV